MGEITIDYTVAASKYGRLPPVDVHLVLTYDDTQTAIQKRQGAFEVTNASGTFTTTTNGVSTTQDIVGIKRRHSLGNDDNWVYPGQAEIVDRHGLTFTYSDPLKGPSKAAMDHTKSVNFFYNPKANVKQLQQFESFHSRDIENLKIDGVATGTAAVSRLAAVVDPMCFAQGTLIRTARCDVAVEALRVGDLAVTASGALRPVKWLGHRRIDLRSNPRAAEVGPIRIAAHGFGPGLPARDLFLSPGHPVLVGADADNENGHLVPIMCLVNGTSVHRVAAEAVTWWHVELDSHDILLAEGLPAESYIELGDRAFFTNEAVSLLETPDLVLAGVDGRCRPVAIEGPVVEAERLRLDAAFATRLSVASAWPRAEFIAADF